MFKLTRISVPVLLALWLAACGSTPDPVSDPRATPASMYSQARALLDSGDYASAVTEYEKLEARFPYGQYAEQAQIDIAYAYYKQRDAASTIAAADRFIKLHPNHPSVDYAYYLKGLANYNEDQGLFSFVYKQDLSERDPKASRESFDTFKDLVTRFPDSRYAADATQRMQALVDALAQHELHVARYYLGRRAPLAAVNRAQAVVKTYPSSRWVEEALVIMIRGYEQLGLTTLKTDAERVLKQNYPQNVFLMSQNKR